ncbi:MAG: EAL domain-containing protein [Leptolyngbya sp. SIO4C5]|nr:EAL domain-containing protein [Leptolyngbya sp. SIO4C5]
MKRILVIEDEPQVRANIQEILELNDFAVITANDGRAGIQVAKQEQPAIIICDLMMPELDGFEVLAALRQQPETALVPLIFLTARSDRADMRRGMELGADDYLTKPFEPSELLRAVVARLEKQASLVQHYSEQVTAAKNQLDYAMHHHAITDLPNWLALQKDFTQLQSQDQHGSLALIIFHIREFNAIRTSLGQTFSGLLLKDIAFRIQSCCQASKFNIQSVSHIEADLFSVLLDNQQQAQQLAEKLLAELKKPYDINNHHISIEILVGLAAHTQESDSLEALVRQAESAIAQTANSTVEAGQNGSNYSSLLSTPFSLVDYLKYALEKDEFTIHYQPQVDLRSGHIIGAEALLRWHNPELGMVSPAQFIPVAEESNLIVPIGEWVLSTVCAQLKQWQSQKLKPITIAINLSAQQFKQPDLVSKICQFLGENDLDPYFLDIELTESLLVKDIDLTLKTLHQLKELGINVAVDDFGTGYSSLSYLQRFPFDTLKIDQCFVRNINSNSGNMAIVKAIIQMAHSLNLSTIAEGVETPEELAFLRKNSCEAIQGYLFSPPLMASSFEKMLLAEAS